MQFAKGVPLVPFVPLSLLKRIEISIPNKPFLPLITTLSLSYHYPSYRHSIVIRETFDRLSTEIRQRTSGPIPSDERPSSGDVQKGQKGQRDTRDTQNKLQREEAKRHNYWIYSMIIRKNSTRKLLHWQKRLTFATSSFLGKMECK